MSEISLTQIDSVWYMTTFAVGNIAYSEFEKFQIVFGRELKGITMPMQTVQHDEFLLWLIIGIIVG